MITIVQEVAAWGFSSGLLLTEQSTILRIKLCVRSESDLITILLLYILVTEGLVLWKFVLISLIVTAKKLLEHTIYLYLALFSDLTEVYQRVWA
jgi:hypothetical protein